MLLGKKLPITAAKTVLHRVNDTVTINMQHMYIKGVKANRF